MWKIVAMTTYMKVYASFDNTFGLISSSSSDVLLLSKVSQFGDYREEAVGGCAPWLAQTLLTDHVLSNSAEHSLPRDSHKFGLSRTWPPTFCHRRSVWSQSEECWYGLPRPPWRTSLPRGLSHGSLRAHHLPRPPDTASNGLSLSGRTLWQTDLDRSDAP